MHTARFETVCVSVAATRCQNWGGLEVNKFEQVSSVCDEHQM